MARKWWLVIFGCITHAVNTGFCYFGMSAFFPSIEREFGWSRTAISGAFSLARIESGLLGPIEGYFVDKYGPRVVVIVGGIFVAIGWAMNAYADTLFLLYAAAIVSGIGAGCVYGTCVGNALKWFGDRRGLAAGLTAMGFGGGAAATVVPIIYTIETYGYQSAFLWFGLAQGAIVLLLAPFLKAPLPGQIETSAKKKVNQSLRDFTPGEMLKTPLFYVLYVMFTMVAAGGLMATAQLGPIARDFGLDRLEIVFLGIAGTTLVVAGIVDNILNGVARPFFGWVSDQIGREITMFIAFTAGAFSLWGLSIYGADPYAFVLLFGLVYFTWGEIYSLFPATCTDAFGAKYAATNAGLLYTAKGTASIIGGPLAAALVAIAGNWQLVFWIAAAMDAAAAIMALLVLKPMLAAHTGRYAAPARAATPQAAE